jgi:hypothetical protein
MTAGFLPSPDNLTPQTTISTLPEKQDTPASSQREVSSPITKLGEFVEFCIRYPEFFKFIFQCILTLVVMSFCIFQLANGGHDRKGKNDALYWGGITSILAWWMPSPSSGVSQANGRREDTHLEAPKAEHNPPPANKSAPEEER